MECVALPGSLDCCAVQVQRIPFDGAVRVDSQRLGKRGISAAIVGLQGQGGISTVPTSSGVTSMAIRKADWLGDPGQRM